MDLWVKAAHIISIVCWMAALLYLPRLFIYHCDAEKGSKQSETFKIMERRLMKAIATPSLLATWVFGLWLAFSYDYWADLWFIIKFSLVIVMSGFHFYYAACIKAFATDNNQKTAKFYRICNEVPAVLLILIVILVVVKPF